jgi:catechol 1,2-dioxygenase
MGDSISLDGKGEPLYMSGKVLNESGVPIEGALLDVWQTSYDGFYDVQDARQPAMNLRGQFTTGDEGRYFFRSVKPSSYPIPSDGTVGTMLAALGRHPMRPAHVHFIVSAPGYQSVTTHVFVDGDPYLDSDAVFGVKESLIVPFVRHDDPAAAERLGLGNPFYTAEYDFVLVRTAVAEPTPLVTKA